MKIPAQSSILYPVLKLLAEDGPMTPFAIAQYRTIFPREHQRRDARIEAALSELVGCGCLSYDSNRVYRLTQRAQWHFDGIEIVPGTAPDAPVAPPRTRPDFAPLSAKYLTPVRGTRPGSNDHLDIPSLHNRKKP